jgi:uracil-DNA glycosylase
MYTWSSLLSKEKEKKYFQQIISQIEKQRELGLIIFPNKNQVFNAFSLTPFNTIKVVILGQDPYHGSNQAHGLSFSVLSEQKIPPSLNNIYKELSQDISGFIYPSKGNLEYWAKQGVLLLNTVLTVVEGQAHSHQNLGWETFTDKVIQQINIYSENVVFLLWGKHAQKKGVHIDRNKHLILTSSHPSPLSAHRGFLGSQHFSKTNAYLVSKNKNPIDWQI